MIEIDIIKDFPDFTLSAKFEVEQGLTVIFGPSGAGKSSIVNLISGIERPREGLIRVNGKVLFDSKQKINLAINKRGIGHVFQDNLLFPHMSVEKNLLYGCARVSSGAGLASLEEISRLLGLEPLLHRKPGTLSGGERKRVAIGRALLSNPGFLIMDEPLAGLDESRKQEILPFIETVRDHFAIPILYITHSLTELTRLADTVVLMRSGQVVETGPTGQILGRLDLAELTGGYDAGSILSGTVKKHDSEFHLTELETEAGIFSISEIDQPEGRKIRLKIRARDVALSLERVSNISVLNQFEGKIIEFRGHNRSMVDILVDIGFPLSTRITRKSFAAMELQKGSQVWVMIKSATIDRQTSK